MKPTLAARWVRLRGGALLLALGLAASALGGETAARTAPPGLSTNTAPFRIGEDFHSAGSSLIRVVGAFMLVLAVFLGAAWLFKHWQRLPLGPHRAAGLRVLEIKSVGHRQALAVIEYRQERFLITTSPNGARLISRLSPPVEEKTYQDVEQGVMGPKV